MGKRTRRTFESWWDPDKWDWRARSQVLARWYADYFDIWWDPKRFNWQSASWALAEYCKEHFHKWWNPVKFNWEDGLHFLAMFCKPYFDYWWCCSNVPTFDYNKSCTLLALLCLHYQEYLDIWLPCLLEKFPWLGALVRALSTNQTSLTRVALAITLSKGGDSDD